MLPRRLMKEFHIFYDSSSVIMMKIMLLLLLMSSVHSLQLESQASTKKPRTTKYSKTTPIPGATTESSAKERSLSLATYRLIRDSGETCILFTVDGLIDISYVTKLNERADANTFIPNNAKVDGSCKYGDADILLLSFKEFLLEFSFAKTPGGERWYVDMIRLMYNSTARILEHAAGKGRRVTLTTPTGSILFPTPVGKSYMCPGLTTIELTEGDGVTPNTGHRAQLLLRDMRLQAFMFKVDADFGPSWHCSNSARSRSETAPVAVGAALAIATAGTLIGYAVWRYLKVKKVQYDTME